MKKVFLNRENSKRISQTFILNYETLLPKITAMLAGERIGPYLPMPTSGNK